jgi:hypothetical protein
MFIPFTFLFFRPRRPFFGGALWSFVISMVHSAAGRQRGQTARADGAGGHICFGFMVDVVYVLYWFVREFVFYEGLSCRIRRTIYKLTSCCSCGSRRRRGHCFPSADSPQYS